MDSLILLDFDYCQHDEVELLRYKEIIVNRLINFILIEISLMFSTSNAKHLHMVRTELAPLESE